MFKDVYSLFVVLVYFDVVVLVYFDVCKREVYKLILLEILEQGYVYSKCLISVYCYCYWKIRDKIKSKK